MKFRVLWHFLVYLKIESQSGPEECRKNSDAFLCSYQFKEIWPLDAIGIVSLVRVKLTELVG